MLGLGKTEATGLPDLPLFSREEWKPKIFKNLRHCYTTRRGQQWQRISVKRVLDRLYGKTPGLSGMESPAEDEK
jgi:hypothetical protein